MQIACRELGIDPFGDARPLTVTGGLTFAGGPGNNYVTHSIATLVERLREDPDALGLATAVGWYLTKHAVGIYGARSRRDTPVHRRAGPGRGRRHADGARAPPASPGRPRPRRSRSSTRARASRPSARSPRCCRMGGGPSPRRTDAEVLAALGEAPVSGREVQLDGLGGVDL